MKTKYQLRAELRRLQVQIEGSSEEGAQRLNERCGEIKRELRRISNHEQGQRKKLRGIDDFADSMGLGHLVPRMGRGSTAFKVESE